MSKEDIAGGLKIALENGASLKEAMQSFYNAGYKKEDVEESARSLQNSGFFRAQTIGVVGNNMEKLRIQGDMQKNYVSNYPPEQNKSRLGMIILIIGILIITLLLILAVIFKDKIISFFG